MKQFIIRISLFIILILSFTSCEQKRQVQLNYEYKLHLGDDIAFAAPDFDDSEWLTREAHNIVTNKGVFWVRLPISFDSTKLDLIDLAVHIGSTANYEVFWDGIYIGKNGSLDNDEQLGTYLHDFMLPDSLIQEKQHILAFRMIKTYYKPGFQLFTLIGNFKYITQAPLQVSKYMFFIAGCFFLGGLYFLFLGFIGKKDFGAIIFSVICFLFLGLVMMEYLKLFYRYEYPFQRTRLEIIGLIHSLLALLVPFFYMILFQFPWKKHLLTSTFIAVIFLGWYHFDYFDMIAKKHNIVLWVSSIIVLLHSVIKRKKGGLFVLFTLIISILFIFLLPRFRFDYVSNFDVSLFLSFTLIVMSMIYIMSQKRKDEQYLYEQSLVLSERLKNELLKKNIKPHFIMNTLTSLIDWVEESPAKGVEFIHALANEFEVLNQIADYQLIPIDQEIKLCKSHLRIMSFRKEIDYIWSNEGIDSNEIIPPAIIHTAVENGVTHCKPNEDNKIYFNLKFTKNKLYKIYTLTIIAKVEQQDDEFKEVEGTGTKYIKSRLQESYPDKWNLASSQIANGWETVISIKQG